MARLDTGRQKKLEPTRMEAAKREIYGLGLEITYYDHQKITFLFKNRPVTYYPYSGWATGKSIEDGRGLENLLNQLKEINP